MTTFTRKTTLSHALNLPQAEKSMLLLACREWSMQLLVGARSSSAHVDVADTTILRKGRWRKLILTDQYEAALRRKRKADGYNAVMTSLSGTTSTSEFLESYFRNFAITFRHYSHPFHRQWRGRRYCASQRAFAGVINEMVIQTVTF